MDFYDEYPQRRASLMKGIAGAMFIGTYILVGGLLTAAADLKARNSDLNK